MITTLTGFFTKNENGNATYFEKNIYKFHRYQDIFCNKEFFIAEYNSLRSEIQQRISQQTTLLQVAITAWGLILSYSTGKDVGTIYDRVHIILIYPLIAYFLSFGWAFNNTRICQIGNYLKQREKQLSKHFKFIGWENYVYDVDNKSRANSRIFLQKIFIKLLKSLTGTNKVKPGLSVLSGTQFLSLGIAIVLLLREFTVLQQPVNMVRHLFTWLGLLFDAVITYLTLLTITKSGRVEFTKL